MNVEKIEICDIHLNTLWTPYVIRNLIYGFNYQNWTISYITHPVCGPLSMNMGKIEICEFLINTLLTPHVIRILIFGSNYISINEEKITNYAQFGMCDIFTWFSLGHWNRIWGYDHTGCSNCVQKNIANFKLYHIHAKGPPYGMCGWPNRLKFCTNLRLEILHWIGYKRSRFKINPPS